MIKLQRESDTEHAELAGLVGEKHREQWKRWREAAEAVQTAITEAAGEDENRYELEARVKKAARHPELEG
ncbi:hypothetical protein EEJ42_16340 [Streptomyces botrytidirepellens]|uniref:Uncharacterized protein n=1 Tax=Streptomyces botrytidirepellens TaxID=2486417 RepID=A0A3M8W7Y5_9ACTN|nr:hypothetical protein EEJ42_16340 [Streptomyces botrytidirepellens]